MEHCLRKSWDFRRLPHVTEKERWQWVLGRATSRIGVEQQPSVTALEEGFSLKNKTFIDNHVSRRTGINTQEFG